MTEQEVPAEEPATPEISEHEGLPGPLEGIEVQEGETGEISQEGETDAPPLEEEPSA